MEQNEIIEEVKTNNVEATDMSEESLQNEVATDKVEVETDSPRVVKGENSGNVASESVEESPAESLSAAAEHEIYQKLKTELMEEIRKYFDPILKQGRPLPEELSQGESLPPERENNLINRIIDESGW
jgi:hypothetical protein